MRFRGFLLRSCESFPETQQQAQQTQVHAASHELIPPASASDPAACAAISLPAERTARGSPDHANAVGSVRTLHGYFSSTALVTENSAEPGSSTENR